MIKLIVAMDKNGLIGKNNKLPWHIPEELAFFKKTTMGNDLLMGGNTFLSLPKKLPGRKHIVFKRTLVNGADEWVSSKKELQKLFNKYKESEKTLWIAGGKFVYENYFNQAEELFVSIIQKEYEGDVYLDMDLSNYKKSVYKENEKFKVFLYTK